MIPTNNRPELLAAALAAAARGWHVFPLRPGSKRPAFPDHLAADCTRTDPRCQAAHQGWEPRATIDPDRIRRAWQAAAFNVGIACGPSGLLVVDLDMPKPDDRPAPLAWQLPGVRDGGDVLTVLAERAGARAPFDTHTVRTPSGGRHLYFVAPNGLDLGNTAGENGRGLGWLIDTRGRGGYVVAAGSSIDGRPYTVENDTDPAPLPDWLRRQLTSPPPPARPARAAPQLGAGRRGAYLHAVLTAEVDRVAAATKPGRNHVLFTAAHALGKLVAGGELDHDQVTDLLTSAALSTGLRPGEISRTIISGLHTGANRPRTLQPGTAA